MLRVQLLPKSYVGIKRPKLTQVMTRKSDAKPCHIFSQIKYHHKPFHTPNIELLISNLCNFSGLWGTQNIARTPDCPEFVHQLVVQRNVFITGIDYYPDHMTYSRTYLTLLTVSKPFAKRLESNIR